MTKHRKTRILPTLGWCAGACLFSFVGLSLLGRSSGGLKEQAQSEQKADRIVVVKSNHTMTLLEKGRVLKVYKVALGRGAAGRKEREGDNKTPEGQYVIDQKNSRSRFHLALHISYPNVIDRKRAADARADPGGAIMIHGLENGLGWLGPVQHDVDWTEGCIAVSNAEIDEIWRLVPVGTPIEIKP
jgi:murein L,D-transpeptidase YafK